MKTFLLFKTLFLTVFLIGSLAHSQAAPKMDPQDYTSEESPSPSQEETTTQEYPRLGPVPIFEERPDITEGMELIPQNLKEMVYLERHYNLLDIIPALEYGPIKTLGKGLKPLAEPIYFIVVPYKDGFEAINKKEIPAFLQHDKDHFLHPVSESNFNNPDFPFQHYNKIRRIQTLSESPKNLKQLLEKKRKLEKELGDTKSKSFVLSATKEKLIGEIRDISNSLDLMKNHNYPVLKNTGWYGSQVQGHNTLLIWNGEDHSQQFFIKYQRYATDTHNVFSSHIQNAVEASDKLQKLNLKGYKIMKEFSGIQSTLLKKEEKKKQAIAEAKKLPLNKSHDSYNKIFIQRAKKRPYKTGSGAVYGLKGFLVRSVEEITKSTDKGHRVIPLQALLGYSLNSLFNHKITEFTKKTFTKGMQSMISLPPPLIQEFASKQGVSPLEWVTEEYFPKLATLVVDQHYRDGVVAGLHTQNALASITPKGKISHFILRDLTDFNYLKPSQTPPYDKDNSYHIGQSVLFNPFLPSGYQLYLIESFFYSYIKRLKKITKTDPKDKELLRLKNKYIKPYLSIIETSPLADIGAYSIAIPYLVHNLLDDRSLFFDSKYNFELIHTLVEINTGLLNHVNKNHPEIFKKIEAKQKKLWGKPSCQSTFKKP